MTSKHDADAIKRHYSTDENLRIRHETHERYTIPNISFVDWAMNSVPWRGDEQVLDVGSGPGKYYQALVKKHPDIRYVGLDLMPAMLKNHPATDRLVTGDVLRLPFPDDAFDVLMANHMLYHVEDIEAALDEIVRVLKPDGLLVATTNSMQTMPELQVLMRRAIVLLTRQGATQVRPPALPSDSFALENGTRLLSRHFYSVIRYDLPSALVFPSVEPAMAYLESTRDLRETQLPSDVVWDDVMMIMRQQINQLIKHLGELVINKQSGLLIASNNGGPLSEFFAIQAASEHQTSSPD